MQKLCIMQRQITNLYMFLCAYSKGLSWKEANFGWFDHYNLQGATNYILDGIPEERFLYPNRFLISEYTVSMYRWLISTDYYIPDELPAVWLLLWLPAPLVPPAAEAAAAAIVAAYREPCDECMGLWWWWGACVWDSVWWLLSSLDSCISCPNKKAYTCNTKVWNKHYILPSLPTLTLLSFIKCRMSHFCLAVPFFQVAIGTSDAFSSFSVVFTIGIDHKETFLYFHFHVYTQYIHFTRAMTKAFHVANNRKHISQVAGKNMSWTYMECKNEGFMHCSGSGVCCKYS